MFFSAKIFEPHYCEKKKTPKKSSFWKFSKVLNQYFLDEIPIAVCKIVFPLFIVETHWFKGLFHHSQDSNHIASE